jgi:hypothetical protein
MKQIFVLLLFLFSLSVTHAQIAGLASYSVLDMPSTARVAGLGFDYLSLYDDDVALTLDNPSLISPRVGNQLSVGFVNLFSGSNFGSLDFSHSFKHL